MFRLAGLLHAKWLSMTPSEQFWASTHATFDGLLVLMFVINMVLTFQGKSEGGILAGILGVMIYFRWKQARERWSL